MSAPRIVLASASPRRRALLEALGLRDLSVRPVDVDERVLEGEDAARYVERVACEKRDRVLERLLAEGEDDAVVLAGDTSVVRDGVVLGKPVDDAHAREMLASLVGRTHLVMSALAVGRGARRCARLVTTEVVFRDASEEEIARYVATGEGRDKAGSYAIQGIGAGLVRAIRGSYGAVVGLPQVEALELLREVSALEAWP